MPFVVNTIDLIHQIFVGIAVRLHMVVFATRLILLRSSGTPLLVFEGVARRTTVLDIIVAAVHSLNDFVGVRRYVLQVVDLSFTHLDTYCYSSLLLLVLRSLLVAVPPSLPSLAHLLHRHLTSCLVVFRRSTPRQA